MRTLLARIDRQIAVGIAAIVIVVVLLAQFAGSYVVSIAVGLLMWMYLCVAWNIIGGFVGQISFGHAAFFGIGGYVSTYLALAYGVSPWIGHARGRNGGSRGCDRARLSSVFAAASVRLCSHF